MSDPNENKPATPRLSPVLQIAATARDLHKSAVERQRLEDLNKGRPATNAESNPPALKK